MDDLIYETPLGIPRPSCSLPRVGVISTLYKQYAISELNTGRLHTGGLQRDGKAVRAIDTKLIVLSLASVVLQICRSYFLPNCAEKVLKTCRKCA